MPSCWLRTSARPGHRKNTETHMKTMDLWPSGTSAERDVLRRCKNAVRQIAPDTELILYGSRARGDAAPDSDYDLLVLVGAPPSDELERRISSAIYRIERNAGIVISVQIYEREAWLGRRLRSMPLHQNVDRDGVVI